MAERTRRAPTAPAPAAPNPLLGDAEVGSWVRINGESWQVLGEREPGIVRLRGPGGTLIQRKTAQPIDAPLAEDH